MTARLTLKDRPGQVTVADDNTVRTVVDAVVAYSRTGADRQFRIRRPSPSQHIRKAAIFKASEVTGVNAEGVDLLDAPVPSTVEAVAA